MEQIVVLIALVYLTILSLIGYTIMGVDKHKARKRQYRISEKTLVLVAFLGGGIGSFLGMITFRHKTKHLKFVILLPIAALIYSAVVIWILAFLI